MSYVFNISLGAALLFTAATSSGGLLVVLVCCRDAAFMLSFTTGVSLTASISPSFLYFQWKCRSLAVCFTYAVTGCPFESSSVFILAASTLLSLPPPCHHCLHPAITVLLLIISNYTGSASDEQDESTMSLWSRHCQTPHGEPVFMFVG